MAGIEHDPLSDIQNIRRLLDVYRPGFAFLKELIQNADDADASRLLLKWHPGIPGAQHPLLKGPALVSLNNGNFTLEDKHSLLRMGLGNKGGNSGKIGKFGLGTKSIFHVAEAFFFLESDGNPDLRDILNPWSPRFHKDWDSVSSHDWDELQGACSGIAEGLGSWFAMWIPLRSQDHLGGIDAIRNGAGAFPGDYGKCPPELVTPFLSTEPRLGLVLPMLSFLNRIDFEAGGKIHHEISIDRKDKNVAHDGQLTHYQIESKLLPQPAEEWKALPAWPKVFRIQEDASEIAMPDKAEWSHAVILATTPTGKSKSHFRIYWSVFLPVGNEPYVNVELPGAPRDISIFLHGFFFLNDSRTQIGGLDRHLPAGDRDDASGICLAWNRSLACDAGGLLPALLPRLGSWLDQGDLDQDEIAKVVDAIRDSPLWDKLRFALTLEGSFLYSLLNGEWGWHWIPSETPTALVPAISDINALKILKSLTGANDGDMGVALAVDCPGFRGLAGELGAFDDECLDQLREAVGDRALTDEQADVISRILRAALEDEEFPSVWRDVPLFRIRSQGGREWQRVASNRLDALVSGGDVFNCDEHGLASPMGDAVEQDGAPYIAGSNLPPRCAPPNLTYERAAQWITNISELSADPDKRLPLFKRLSKRDRFTELELPALRYLAHAHPDYREDGDATLFFHAEAKSDLWGQAFNSVLSSPEHKWRFVDPRFGKALTDAVKARANIEACSRESWAGLIGSLGEAAGDVDFSAVPRNVIEWILVETPEDRLDCLKHLRIHRFSQTEMVAARDQSVWLDAGLSVPEELATAWRTLRESARILKASENERIHRRESALFGERILDSSGALKRSAESPRPQQYEDLILYLLASGTPSSSAIAALKESSWLTLNDGTTIAPQLVLHLDGLEQVLSNVLNHLDGCAERSSAAVSDKARRSKGWKTLATQIFPSTSNVLELLAERLEAPPNTLAIGFSITTDEELDDWLSIASKSASPQLYPARPLLAELSAQEQLRGHALTIAKALGQSFRGEQAVRHYLGHIFALKAVHDTGERDTKKLTTVLVARFLGGALASGVWDRLRRESSLVLLSGDGRWRPPNKLAPPCAGVRVGALLNQVLTEALKLGNAPRAGAQERDQTGPNNVPEISGAESAEALRTLLAPFRTRLQEKAVAILPALLGSDQETDLLARELLGGIDPKLIRDELIPDDVTVDDQIGGGLRERSIEWSFRVEMIRGETVSLESIEGTEFDAQLAGSSETVFLPNPNGQLLRWAGENRQILCVAEPARFETMTDRKLRDVIFQSISDLMWWAYAYRPGNLEEVFEKYEGLGQLSLGVARQEILRSADTQLQVLGVAPLGLEEAREFSSEARARLSEADSGLGNEERLRKEGEDADKKARALFLEKLDNDVDVHTALLEGMRLRIARQQYELDSIPFEILQNADDAAGELLRHADISDEGLPYVSKFVIHSGDNKISFHYGGRPINSSCGLTGAAANRYKRDLVKMLLLNGSDKNTSGEDSEVTGKFGLGFKSVFLLTDVPRVASGKLTFEILGGIWPKEVDPEVFKDAEDVFGEFAQKTSIVLSANTSRIDESMSRFLSLAPWLPVFTRNIKTIAISSDEHSAPRQWLPEPVVDCGNLRVGNISTADGEKLHIELAEDNVQWVFQIDNGKITDLPDDVPWLWVTAPTREKSFGFALNAPFALDPGRTNLSKQHDDVAATNQTLFKKAAELIRSEFGHLAESQEALETIGAADRYMFWESLWRSLSLLPQSIGDPVGIDYLGDAVWPKSGLSGYAGLIQEHAVVPNGLLHDLKVLTTTHSLGYQIRGWLGRADGCRLLADAIAESFTPFDDPVACCNKRIADVLHRRLGIKLKAFGLIDLLGETVGEGIHVHSDRASLAGEALWPETEDSDQASFDGILDPIEASELESNKDTLRFLSEEGSWEQPSNLILSCKHTSSGDEIMRATFAPPNRVLAESYGHAGARILLSFRERLRADSEEMAQWIEAQGADGVTKGALIYLANGSLRDDVASLLGLQWLSTARESPAFQELDANVAEAIELAFDVAAVRNKRNVLQGGPSWDEPEPPPGPDFATEYLSPSALQDCWDEDEALRHFTVNGPLGSLIAGDPSNIQELLSAPETLGGKATWYRLLCLGCTLGLPLGIRPLNQAQRLWLEELTEEFWQVTIPSSEQESEEPAFNDRLDEYFEQKIHKLFRDENATGENAAFWRRVFYDFRKMHYFVFKNHLPETIMEFASYEEADGSALIGFLRSGKIPEGLQDPTTPRFRGVIGQSMKAPLLFVMRELRLLNILGERFNPACFYMNSPARRIAHKLGWIDLDSVASGDFSTLVFQSERVHERMQDELPDLACYFDLPLQLYALNNPR